MKYLMVRLTILLLTAIGGTWAIRSMAHLSLTCFSSPVTANLTLRGSDLSNCCPVWVFWLSVIMVKLVLRLLLLHLCTWGHNRPKAWRAKAMLLSLKIPFFKNNLLLWLMVLTESNMFYKWQNPQPYCLLKIDIFLTTSILNGYNKSIFLFHLVQECSDSITITTAESDRKPVKHTAAILASDSCRNYRSR